MELQQQQQQVVQLEGLENATARTLLGKLINVLLAVMAVLLVFVSTVANCVVPLMKTRSRTLSTLLLVILLAFLWRHWEAISEYLNRFLLHHRWPTLKHLNNSGVVMCIMRTLTHTGIWISMSYLSLRFSKQSEGLHMRFVTLSLSGICFQENITESKTKAGCLVLTRCLWCICGTSTYYKGSFIFEGGVERTAHLISLFWVNLFTCRKLHFLSHRRICYSVSLLSSWVKWYCFEVTAIFNWAGWCFFSFFLWTVMSRQCSADLVVHLPFFYSVCS